MNLTDLLKEMQIAPKDVLVLRHTPKEAALKDSLSALAAENPDIFNAYQQTQTEKVEKRMAKFKYVAAFIGNEPGKAQFVGLYSNDGAKPITPDDYWQIPANVELKKYGVKGFTTESSRTSILWFDLKPLEDFYPHLQGRMVVRWSGLERNWHRRAADVELLILEPEMNFGLPETLEGLDRVLREVRQRLGQSEFRKQLIAAYDGMCAVTGCDFVYALEAAHLRPYSNSGQAASVPCNGLLLRADIHTLFDLNFLRINPDTMTVDLDESLKLTSYGELHGKVIRYPKQEHLRPKVEFLRERWDEQRGDRRKEDGSTF